MLSISAAEFAAWEQSLRRDLDAAAASSETAASLAGLVDNRIDNLRARMEASDGSVGAGPSPPIVSRSCCDAATQLISVSSVSYSAQIMRRIAAERAARCYSQEVGQLATALNALAEDIGVLLDISVPGLVTVEAMESGPDGVSDCGADSAGAGEEMAAKAAGGGFRHVRVNVPPAEQCEEEADRLLAMLSSRTIAAVCGTSRAFRNRKRREEGKSVGEKRSAREFLRTRLVRRFMAAHAQMTPLLSSLRGRGTSAGPAFLCAKCRGDGRQQFAYDQEQRQLSRTMRRRC